MMVGALGAWHGSSGSATEQGGFSEVVTNVRASTANPNNRIRNVDGEMRASG